jgi:hypothetical protein
MKIRSAKGRGTTCRIIVPDAESSPGGAPQEPEPNARTEPNHSR